LLPFPEAGFGGEASPPVQDLEFLCVDDNDRVRQKLTQEYYKGKLNEIEGFESIIGLYNRWRGEKDYVVLQRSELVPGELVSRKKVIALKAAKRGNNVYIRRLRGRLQGLKDISQLAGRGKVYGYFVTLTCDYSQYKGRVEAWEDVSLKWNRLISWIKRERKKKPPRLSKVYLGFFRVYEATKKGYPHIHAILFFSKKVFIPQSMLNERWGAYTWIERCWSVKKALGYLGKYLQKSFIDGEHVMTPTLLWLFGMQSFGVSSQLFHLIRYMHNSNRFGVQMSLMGGMAYEVSFELIGIFSDIELISQSGGELRLSEKDYRIELDFVPYREEGYN